MKPKLSLGLAALFVAGTVLFLRPHAPVFPPAPEEPAGTVEARQARGERDDGRIENAMRRLLGGKTPFIERKLLEEEVYAFRREMTRPQLRELLEWARQNARNPALPADLRAQALSHLIGLNVLMEERGWLTRDEATQDAPFLMDLAFGDAAHLRLREFALHGLGVLQIAEAAPLLRDFLGEPANIDETSLGRGALRALHRLEGGEAFDVTREVLGRTESEVVFMTAAALLSEQNDFAAASALLDNRHRFPGTDFPSFALVKLEEPVAEALRDPEHPQLREAIIASIYLWKEEQQERLRPVLLDLLETAPPEERKLAADRLILDASQVPLPLEKERLRRILENIESDPELTDHAEQIRLRLTARIVAPSASNSAAAALPQ